MSHFARDALFTLQFRVRCRLRSTADGSLDGETVDAELPRDFECGNVEATEGGEQTSWESEGRYKRPGGVRCGAPEPHIICLAPGVSTRVGCHICLVEH